LRASLVRPRGREREPQMTGRPVPLKTGDIGSRRVPGRPPRSALGWAAGRSPEGTLYPVRAGARLAARPRRPGTSPSFNASPWSFRAKARAGGFFFFFFFFRKPPPAGRAEGGMGPGGFSAASATRPGRGERQTCMYLAGEADVQGARGRTPTGCEPAAVRGRRWSKKGSFRLPGRGDRPRPTTPENSAGKCCTGFSAADRGTTRQPVNPARKLSGLPAQGSAATVGSARYRSPLGPADAGGSIRNSRVLLLGVKSGLKRPSGARFPGFSCMAPAPSTDLSTPGR